MTSPSYPSYSSYIEAVKKSSVKQDEMSVRIEQLERERDALATDLLFYTEDRDFWKDQVTTLADRLATAHNEHTKRIELEIKLADAIKFIEEVRRNGDTRLALMAIDVLDWLRQK